MRANITITSQNCVSEASMFLMRKLKTKPYRVHAWGEIKVKELAKIVLPGGPVLACPVTGTLYSYTTGLSSSPTLYVVGRA